MTSRSAVVLICLLGLPFATVATAAPGGEQRLLDEVVVEGARIRLVRLREQLIVFEDRFYERFNQLNTRDEFDVYCHQEARIGTRLKRRYCRAVYEDRIYREEGQKYLEFLQWVTTETPDEPAMAGNPPDPAYIAILARRKEFRDNMLAVASRHPEVLDLLRERAELLEQYEATRRQIFGFRPLPHEDTAQADPNP